MKAAGLFLLGAVLLCAQAPNPVQTGVTPPPPGAPVPVFHVDVTSRTVAAVNYHNRGTTKINFTGTALMPAARGEADVNAATGATRVNVHFDHLSNPAQFGSEYLTFVLWAITPEGRPERLGEVMLKNPNDTTASLQATTDLQTFGMIVTAEPYFAVSEPSDVVVMENFIRKDTTGTLETVNAKYELLKRGQYTMNVNRTSLQNMTADLRVPLELREAREAIAIANAQGADKYAADTMKKVAVDMQNAEGFYSSRHNANDKEMITDAREATQMAEDARRIALFKEEQIARDTMIREEQEAKARADQEAQRRAQAEAAARTAEQQKKDAEAAMAEARQAQQQAEAARQAALAEEAKLAAEKAEAIKGKQQAESDAQAVRERLKEQLNMILATRDTARGLIVNMSDVLFDFNQATLKPDAKEKLAKLSGIVLAYPTLHLSVEGHTDSIGSDEYNMKLSQRRADAVRDYLVSNGINPANIQAIGYGKANPVASNDTAAGRQQNRRVEMVVSGDVIGQPINQPPSPTSQAQPNQPGPNPAQPYSPQPYQQQNPSPAGNQAPPQR